MVIVYAKKSISVSKKGTSIKTILYLSWTERDNTGKMKRYAKSLKMKDTRENRKIAEMIRKDKLRQLETNPVVINYYYKLPDAVTDFLRLKHGANYLSYKYSFDHLIEFYGNVFVREIKDLTPYYDYLQTIGNKNIKNNALKRTIGTNTIASYMRNAKIFFNWLHDRGFITVKPTYPKVKTAQTRRRNCPIYVVKSVLAHLKDRDKDQYLAILIISLTGIRAGELCRLKWEDFDFEGRVLYINNQKARREDEYFPLYPTAVELLKPFRKTGKVVPYKNKDSFRFFQRTLKNLGLPHYSIHSLRKTFGTELMRMRVPDKVLQDLLRHSDVKTSRQYTFSDLEERSAFAERAIGSQFKETG